MFIISKRNYSVKRADGTSYLIPKDYIGEIPEDVAKSNLVQRAISGGMISTPKGKKDSQMARADKTAHQKAKEHDIRPDAEKKPDGKDESKEA